MILLRFVVAALLSGFLLAYSAGTNAHALGHSYLYLQVYENTVTGRFEIALSDLNKALGLTGTANEVLADSIDDKLDYLHNYYRTHVTVESDLGPLRIEFTEASVLNVLDGFALLSFDMSTVSGEPLNTLPAYLDFDYSVLFEENPEHRGFLLVEYNWASGTFANENQITGTFSPEDTLERFQPAVSDRWKGFRSVIGLGAEHIWEGIDHILFLLALLLASVLRRDTGDEPGETRRFGLRHLQPIAGFMPALIQVATIVTAFTVAHSVTLSLAALGWVELPSRFVEVVIAASIAIAAADLIVPIFRGRLWVIVFGFGLFHGFGFAGALAEMGVLGEHLGLSLFGFNLGVELGQLLIVVLVFPILFAVREWALYRNFAVPVAASLMILVSCAWVVERAFEVDLPIGELLPESIRKWIP